MQQFINQYSFVFVGICLVLFTVFVVSRVTNNKIALVTCLLVIIIFVGVQIRIMSTTNEYDTIQDFDRAMASQDPIFLFLYSDY